VDPDPDPDSESGPLYLVFRMMREIFNQIFVALWTILLYNFICSFLYYQLFLYPHFRYVFKLKTWLVARCLEVHVLW
jgi:hypothetical protein